VSRTQTKIKKKPGKKKGREIGLMGEYAGRANRFPAKKEDYTTDKNLRKDRYKSNGES